jgi:triacylglycerol lipase
VIVAHETTPRGYRRSVSSDTAGAVASFLLPEGYRRPAVAAVLREGGVVTEGVRYAARAAGRRRGAAPWAGGAPARGSDPVLLVPGFLAGDLTLALMARELRRAGHRTYRAHIHCNVGCTVEAAGRLERRIEQIAQRRESRVQLVGHSLGGMLARGLAARRPDLVSTVITMGSPMLAPGAHHVSLSTGVEVLTRLARAGLPGLMAEECVRGSCARQSFEESRQPLTPGVEFSAIWSRRDGIVDWRACVDPLARSVQVRASHLGMAVDPRTLDAVLAGLQRQPALSAVEVDRGVSA